MNLKLFQMFSILLHFFVILIEARSEDTKNSELFYQRPVELPQEERTCVDNNCNVFCAHGHSSNLYFEIQIAQTKSKNRCHGINILSLYNFTFEDQIIPQRWMPIEDNIKMLIIRSSNVERIKPQAFIHYNLTELALDGLKLQFLENDVLTNLKSLRKFEIIQEYPAIEYVEEEFLNPVESNLIDLVFKAGIESPKNLTRANTLRKVDLSFNNFQSLDKDAFKQKTVIEDLNLSHAKITHLPYGVFDTISKTLQQLDLSHNFLKTVSPMIFSSGNLRHLNIQLNSNPWICSCGLQMLLNTWVIPNIEFLMCHDPENNIEVSFKDWKYCKGNADRRFIGHHKVDSWRTSKGRYNLLSDKSTIQTDSSVDETSKKNINVQCKRCFSLHCNETKAVQYKSFSISPRQNQFQIYAKSERSVKITIRNTIKNPHILMWFSKVTKHYYQMEINYKDYGLGCLINVSNTVEVNDLSANSTYTFCLIESGYIEISPFNCLAHYPKSMRPKQENSWITTQMKTIFISLMLAALVCAMIVGGCIVYCIIKKRPTLLRGSKRVILPKASSSDIMVMPRSGSFSKNLKGYENKSYETHRCVHLRRKSSDSVDSSYVSPNLYEIISPKRKECLENIVVCTSIPRSRLLPKRMSDDPLPDVPCVNLHGRQMSGSSA